MNTQQEKLVTQACFTDTLFETKYKTYIQDVFNEKRRLTKSNSLPTNESIL